MDEIKELIKIIINNTKRNLPLLDLKNQRPSGNKEMTLFLGIKNGEFNDDAEASYGIYGSREVDFKFRMLKSRLNRKLLNHLFFVDFSSTSFTKSANLEQEALDYLHFSKMLLNIDETKLGSKLLNKTIDLAKECEYTGIVIDCLRALREVYAKTYRPKLFQNIKREINGYEAIAAFEEQANAIFQENRLSINSTVNNRKKSLQPYKIAIEELKNLYQKSNSYNIFEQYFKMNVWYFELKGDFKQVLKLIDDVENELAKGKINQKRFDTSFIQFSKGNALIKLSAFKEGSIFLEKMLDEIDSSTKAWYSFAEKHVRLYIQNKQFDEASEIFFRVLNNKTFDDLEENEVLKWDIFRNYLYFLTNNKKLIKKYDHKAFVDVTPEFIKEYAGYHVAILILQVLNKVDVDLSYLHHKLDAMDDYVNKYLNNSFSKRTKTFCKLLHKITIHNKDYYTILAKSKYLQEKLSESDITGESFVDFEVVPYEFLWDNVMDQVKRIRAYAQAKN